MQLDRFFMKNLILLTALIVEVFGINEILVAINAGGKEHTDVHGVKYTADPARQGIPSDHGKRYIIGRVEPEDQPLYQTERYNTGNLEYELDLSGAKDGDYVLVMKFSEVYFEGPNQKVFDIAVNDHTIIPNVDIFAQVGKAVAHDEIVPFTIKSRKLVIAGDSSDFDGTFNLQFVQGLHDNPKINAFYIMKGKPADVPELLPLDKMDEEFLQKPLHEQQKQQQSEEDFIEDEPEARERFASGPQISDPYAQQEASQMFIPVLVALACFFPVLFCLCRL